MKYKIIELKKGIKLHVIDTNKFKTNIVSVFLTTPINKKNVTFNSVVTAVLRRGSKSMPSQDVISKELEEMYGATFNCGIEKTGDNQVLKFYLESINDNFIPQSDNNMLKTSIEKLLDIVFNPLVEKDKFKEDYVEQEKNNIKQIIESKKDNKAKYALNRCIEEMYKGQAFGLYKDGNVEDLPNINSKNLYEYYKELISKCKIDIFVSGNVNQNVEEIFNQNVNIDKLISRSPEYNKCILENKSLVDENIVKEDLDVTQGKLILGLDVNIKSEDEKYVALLYNSILGGSATSKLFQNVREKASLAYTASSSYLKNKSNIFINCGIEINNYEKALGIIREQLDDMKNGNFTEDDIQNSKKTIVSSIKGISDEQDTEIMFFFGQELVDSSITIEEYIEKVVNVNKQDIIDIAQKVNINTIYFLYNSK